MSIEDIWLKGLLKMVEESRFQGYSRGDMVLHIPIKGSSQRLGQKLCNYFHSKGYKNEDIHAALFHIWDEEFFEALVMDDNKLAKRFNKAAKKSGKVTF